MLSLPKATLPAKVPENSVNLQEEVSVIVSVSECVSVSVSVSVKVSGKVSGNGNLRDSLNVKEIHRVRVM